MTIGANPTFDDRADHVGRCWKPMLPKAPTGLAAARTRRRGVALSRRAPPPVTGLRAIQPTGNPVFGSMLWNSTAPRSAWVSLRR